MNSWPQTCLTVGQFNLKHTVVLSLATYTLFTPAWPLYTWRSLPMSNIKAIFSPSGQESYHRGQQAANQVGQRATNSKTMTSNFTLTLTIASSGCWILRSMVEVRIRSTQNWGKIFRTEEQKPSRLWYRMKGGANEQPFVLMEDAKQPCCTQDSDKTEC